MKNRFTTFLVKNYRLQDIKIDAEITKTIKAHTANNQ